MNYVNRVFQIQNNNQKEVYIKQAFQKSLYSLKRIYGKEVRRNSTYLILLFLKVKEERRKENAYSHTQVFIFFRILIKGVL